jgi:hypothetical protein
VVSLTLRPDFIGGCVALRASLYEVGNLILGFTDRVTVVFLHGMG